MLSVKEATTKALESFKEFYGTQFGNLMLEEVEQSGVYWYITLGYDLPPTGLGFAGIIANASGQASRGYKVFKIDGSTGAILSMKIREVTTVE